MLTLLKGYLRQAKSIVGYSCCCFSTAKFTSDNPYTVLGVKPTDTEKQIKSAYRKLSKAYHPDVNTDPEAVNILKNINNAYDMIKKAGFKLNLNANAQSTYSRSWNQNSHYRQQSTRYDDTNWHEEYYKESEKRQREEAEQRERAKKQKKYEQEKAHSSAKRDEYSKADSEFSSKDKAYDEYAGYTDEDIYFKVFRKTYREDPAFFYKAENLHLRKKYEEILNKKRKGAQEQEDDTQGQSTNQRAYESTSSRGSRESSYENSSGRSYDSSSHQDGNSFALLPGIGILIAGCLIYLLIFKQKDNAGYQTHAQTKSIMSKPKLSTTVENAEMKVTQAASTRAPENKAVAKAIEKAAEENEQKKKAEVKRAILTDLPLMKKYPRVNPDALSMLTDYTIWLDLNFYSVSHDHFYQKVDSTLSEKQFKPSEISNTRLNTKLNLAIEAERAFKNVFVPIDSVLGELKEQGYYKPPVVLMRFWGFIMVEIREKPIVAENLLKCIENKEAYISLFDLFWRYSTPILMANYDDYAFPVTSTKYAPNGVAKEGEPWLGHVTLNHRPIMKKILQKNEKNVFMWRGRDRKNPAESEYITCWTNFYETLKKFKNQKS